MTQYYMYTFQHFYSAYLFLVAVFSREYVPGTWYLAGVCCRRGHTVQRRFAGQTVEQTRCKGTSHQLRHFENRVDSSSHATCVWYFDRGHHGDGIPMTSWRKVDRITPGDQHTP